MGNRSWEQFSEYLIRGYEENRDKIDANHDKLLEKINQINERIGKLEAKVMTASALITLVVSILVNLLVWWVKT